VLHLTIQAALQAALLTNVIYGVLILLPAQARATLAPDDLPWVLGTGAAGHMLHALTAPDRALALNISLICASLWMLIISAPEIFQVVIRLL
jgi:hypothetical protein